MRVRIAVVCVVWAMISGVSFVRAEAVISPIEESMLGDRKLALLLERYPLHEDGSLWLRVKRVGRDVGRVSDRPDLVFEYLVLRADELQAWSYPNGAVCLSDTMLALHESDDELAFTLGHEMAHTILRHEAQRIRREVLLENEPGIEADQVEDLRIRFDRDEEREADRYGALYAVRAGYRFSAAPEFLERLASALRPGTFEGETHPGFEDRVRELLDFRDKLERSAQAFDLGVEALRGGRAKEAIDFFKWFNRQYPQSVEGLVNLGAAYLAAIRAKAGTPDDLAEPLPILPEAGIRIRGSYRRANVEQAMANFEQALRNRPDHPHALAGLGIAHLRLQEFDRARERLRAANAADPASPEIVLLLGNVAYLTGDYELAWVHYTRALDLRPGWSDARVNLARTLESLDRTKEARILWEELRGDPRFGWDAARRLRASDPRQ